MATAADIALLRGYINEPLNAEPYTDEELGLLIDNATSVDQVAGIIWRQKAAGYAELTDISEGGSSRAASKLYAQALAMREEFSPTPDTTAAAARATTRPISRD